MFDCRPLPVAAVVCLLVGTAAFGTTVHSGAYLSDDAAGAGNLQAGVLDVKLSEVGHPTGDGTADERGEDRLHRTWGDYNHSVLGADSVTNTVEVNTSGDLAVDTVNVSVSYAENDSASDDGNAANTSRTIEVTNVTYDGRDLTAADLTDQNGNGLLDLADLTHGSNADNLSSLSGFGSDGSASLTITFSGEADTLDGVGSGDGVDVRVDVRGEAASFADSDDSINNTIRYD